MLPKQISTQRLRWAPRAKHIYVNGVFGGAAVQGQTLDLETAPDNRGYWTGFYAGSVCVSSICKSSVSSALLS